MPRVVSNLYPSLATLGNAYCHFNDGTRYTQNLIMYLPVVFFLSYILICLNFTSNYNPNISYKKYPKTIATSIVFYNLTVAARIAQLLAQWTYRHPDTG